jgi:putative phosphoribosyl transferase
LKKRGAKSTVVATPVAPPDVVAMLAQEADDVIALEVPPFMGAIGFFYVDFSQVSDAEVTDILKHASQASAPKQQAG